MANLIPTEHIESKKKKAVRKLCDVMSKIIEMQILERQRGVVNNEVLQRAT